MPIERFAEVLEDLRAKILDGTYPIDEALPHTERLKATYSVSAAVITRAMKELKTEGLIWRVANRGMIVLPSPVPVALSNATAPHHEHQRWEEACRSAGVTGRIQADPRTTTAPADNLLAQVFNINEGDPIVWWRRTAMVNEDTAVFHDRVYYPRSILDERPPGAVTPETVSIALSRINPSTSYADITTKVRPCKDKEASMLKISEGMPVYDITRTIRDEDGRTYELLRRIANPLRVRLVEHHQGL
ncbi:GntR family transcriptional regulator [Nonomuraea sediminis]|uniref:GntR family transcriptional regulator n=1 Tax=Nonomuraea sediminis TaxID=2835864 RepID=UPI001BDD1CC1|nr:GntR family transcriptional regulator [Nonomuraea sediminis]